MVKVQEIISKAKVVNIESQLTTEGIEGLFREDSELVRLSAKKVEETQWKEGREIRLLSFTGLIVSARKSQCFHRRQS